MKKKLLNLGRTLDRNQQKNIKGGMVGPIEVGDEIISDSCSNRPCVLNSNDCPAGEVCTSFTTRKEFSGGGTTVVWYENENLCAC
ncbi:hypothetical protein SAMN04487910_2574 [Aquimarina amphilecti]|uniref:Uncharacterized protein n=1 Tax=Aquimarina amphilecti TaxID=1038014 RepID=A0A1H7QJ70_AQUAM|nr:MULTISPECIES: hypothetical protein [Aquimarina]AXT54434.1 hypothetical protein D1815_01250 [Aquimarina sp. AD1]RKN36734.1 hypothetical protein D7035_02075 [Aquimarina sp. AD1]SEL47819.1 hypothetical protein SAMN04487910_2574 [Aquimarina amphilecti]